MERKRRQTSRKKRSEEAATRTQIANALIFNVKRGSMRKEETERMLEIFGKGSGQEIENANTMERSPNESKSFQGERSSWKRGTR